MEERNMKMTAPGEKKQTNSTRRNNMIRWSNIIFVLVALLTGFWFMTGCEKTTTEPGTGDFEVSQSAEEGLAGTWQTVHSLSSVEQVNSIVTGEDKLNESEYGGINSTLQLNRGFHKLNAGLQQALTVKVGDRILTGDSLIWFIDWTDPVLNMSVRKAFYYNSETGIARYYEAIYQFPNQLKLAYDSTQIRVDLNYTFNDSTDDKFLNLYKLSLFKDGFYVNRIEVDAEATDWDGANQVTGAIMNNHVWYSTQTQLSELTQQLELNPDESGQIDERLDYRDGTFLHKLINFYADYTGDFTEHWRDGTEVSGTFDRIEDDNHASFTRSVDFPNGHILNKIEQVADVTINPEDSSSHMLLNEKQYFTSGLLDTSELEIDEYFENGLKKTHLIGHKSDGSEADLLVTHYPEYQEVDGHYISPRGHFSLINAILYSDGSGEIWLKVYQNQQAYLNGEPPLVVIYLHFNPDGSGEGTVTENEITYHVTVSQNGEMKVINSEGKSRIVSGY